MIGPRVTILSTLGGVPNDLAAGMNKYTSGSVVSINMAVSIMSIRAQYSVVADTTSNVVASTVLIVTLSNPSRSEEVTLT